MERRFVLFLVLSFGILLSYYWLFAPPPRKVQPAEHAAAADAPKPPADGKQSPPKAKAEEANAEKPLSKLETPAPVVQAAPEPDVPEQWVTLGSADPKDPCRMLVTLTNMGAAVVRVELNSPRYCDVDDRSGYLGHLVMDTTVSSGGCLVQVVGPGTPAAEAGLAPGDIIKSVNDKPVTDSESLDAILNKTKPRQTATLSVERKGETLSLKATLRRRPLEVIKPEGNDPLSLLLTLSQIDDLNLNTQWARDVAIGALFTDLNSGDLGVSEQDLASLDVADVRLSEKKIHVSGNDQRKEQWILLGEASQKALNAWQILRGDKPGALFCHLPTGVADDRLSGDEVRQIMARVRNAEDAQHNAGPFYELEGVNLRRGTWKVVSAEPDRVEFRRLLPAWGLEVVKTYRLAKLPAEAMADDSNYPAYHIEFDIEIRNVGGVPHKVAYRLDGPNGLPTEGKWYASKVSRNWGGGGLRDFIVSFGGGTPEMTGPAAIADGKTPPPRPDTLPDKTLTFIGVDAQYFSAVLMPQRKNPADVWFEELLPICVGKIDPEHKNLGNTSCRLVGTAQELKPGGALRNGFKLFAGPKKPALLRSDEYKLGELVYYGWPIFAMVAVPLTVILHGFYAVVGNYGLAIILLTILVRGCMFPLSRKQAIGAQKMQMLQPEIKKIQEKYKNNTEGRTKAQQELFRKHNYNPLAGCLPIFIQMPVFIGLYRSLMVAIELRDAPLITNSIRWCSNLAAPDMLYDWRSFMPAFINNGVGIFGLGPYFNLLPILTIILFIWQQKMFMPPAADEQAAMQQKIMQYMMIFMGLLFFKVASGLCIYFIASSLWGLAERKFLPKAATAGGTNAMETRAQAKQAAQAAAAREEAARAKKSRAKK